MESAIERSRDREEQSPARDLASDVKENWLLYLARAVLLVSFIGLVVYLCNQSGADWGPMLISMSVLFSGSLTTLAILKRR